MFRLPIGTLSMGIHGKDSTQEEVGPNKEIHSEFTSSRFTKSRCLCGECSSYIDISCYRFAPNQEAMLLHKKGKGQGKQKPHHSGNPFGPDGNRLKCHHCGSEEHLARWCARNSGKGSAPTTHLISRLVAEVDSSCCDKIILEDEYNEAEEVTAQ